MQVPASCSGPTTILALEPHECLLDHVTKQVTCKPAQLVLTQLAGQSSSSLPCCVSPNVNLTLSLVLHQDSLSCLSVCLSHIHFDCDLDSARRNPPGWGLVILLCNLLGAGLTCNYVVFSSVGRGHVCYFDCMCFCTATCACQRQVSADLTSQIPAVD